MQFWLAACLRRAALDAFLAVAERQMASFPGRSLAAWELHLHGLVEYRDPAEFEHLRSALRAAGLS